MRTTKFKANHGIGRYVGPKRAILLMVLVSFFACAWHCYKSGVLSPAIVEQYRNNHPLCVVVLFICIYAVCVIAALPSLPLNLAAGFFWGGLAGGIYSAIGVTVGGWISFLAARWLIGQPLTKRFNMRWASVIQEEFEHSGWKFVAFARINPIIPTGPLNFLLGLTSLSNLSFLWSTFAFLLPPAIAVAYIGDTLQTFATQQASVMQTIYEIVVVSTAATSIFIIRFVAKIYARRRQTNQSSAQKTLN